MSAVAAGPARPAPAKARPDRRRRDRALTIAAVAIPTALATALCLYDITTRSLWLDEAATFAIASQHGSAFGAALAHDGGNMLGYYGLLHVLIGAFGKGTLVLRLPSALGAGATVCLVCLLGLRLFGRQVACAAGLLAAVSLPLVYWGQNARGYSLMLALIAGSFLALVTAVQKDRAASAWVAYVVLTVAAVYAGLEAVLVVPAQLVLVFWFRARVRPFAIAVATGAACCVPLAILAAGRGSGQLFWVPAPSFTTAKQVVQSLASTGLQPNFYTGTGDLLLALTGGVLLLGLVRISLLLRPAATRAESWRPVLVLAWIVVPFLLALLESAFGQSVFQARYLLVSLPAVALLLAWTALAPGSPRLLGVAVVAVLIGLRAAQLVPAYGVSPENWRAASAYVVAQSRPADCVAFYPLDNRMPFQYYTGSRARNVTPILPAVPSSAVRAYVEDYATLTTSEASRLPTRCARVWLLSSHEGAVGGPPISRANYARLQSLLAGLGREYPHAISRTFGTARTITVTLFSGTRARSGT